MMTMKSKGSLLVTLGIQPLALRVCISSESFARSRANEYRCNVLWRKRATKTEGVIKPIEQPVTDKDKNVTTTRQSEQKNHC